GNSAQSHSAPTPRADQQPTAQPRPRITRVLVLGRTRSSLGQQPQDGVPLRAGYRHGRIGQVDKSDAERCELDALAGLAESRRKRLQICVGHLLGQTSWSTQAPLGLNSEQATFAEIVERSRVSLGEHLLNL